MLNQYKEKNCFAPWQNLDHNSSGVSWFMVNCVILPGSQRPSRNKHTYDYLALLKHPCQHSLTLGGSTEPGTASSQGSSVQSVEFHKGSLTPLPGTLLGELKESLQKQGPAIRSHCILPPLPGHQISRSRSYRCLGVWCSDSTTLNCRATSAAPTD